jgi:tellurite resistance protein TerC
VFRVVFIALGFVLMKIHWIVWLFGAFLIFIGLKMMLVSDKGLELDKNPVIRLFWSFVPVTQEFHDQRFFVRLDGVLHASPLFVSLLFVEVTDIIFAVDSVPAIYALTDEPLIVFTSNVFAILGLRSMYFMLAGAVDRFHMLKYGLALVLIFVGLKMVWLNPWYGGKFPITSSLGFIGAVLITSILLSLLIPERRTAVAGRPVDVTPHPEEAVGGVVPKTVSRSGSSKPPAPSP